MVLRLAVHRRNWHAHVQTVAASLPGLVPVVKGNGYGFGRSTLMPIAAGLSAQIAVGTVFEAADVPDDRTPIVLTPHLGALPLGFAAEAILTVGSIAHVEALVRHGWQGRVTVKLQSSMRRYGVAPADLDPIVAAIHAAGWTLVSYTLHLPLAGTQDNHITEITAWLPLLDHALPLSVSHLAASAYAALRAAHQSHSFQIRSGTALWHGDKSTLQLTADVLDIHPVGAVDTAGYHATPAPGAGHVVLVGAGSAHGVRALDDGRSPFHLKRRRVAMLEPPHMHTTILFVPNDEFVPIVGDSVDVQRPLITTNIDELSWLDD